MENVTNYESASPYESTNLRIGFAVRLPDWLGRNQRIYE